MNVLIACEESQTVCKAFRERGHRAFSCDLQECSGGRPEWHIQADALSVLMGDCFFQTQDMRQHEIKGRWDLVIAHPPCTYLSNAGACRLYPRKGELNYQRFSAGLQGKIFFLHFYLYGLYKCGKIAIENPTPSSVYELPPHTQAIQPYQFGHAYSKRTLLWLFGLPPLEPTEYINEYTPFLPSGTGRKRGGASYGAKGMAHDGKPRSVTFSGIAAAMAAQWGNL